MAKSEFPSKLLSNITRLFITASFIALAGGVIYGGKQLLTWRAEAAPSPDAAPRATVSFDTVTQVTGFTQQREFVGQIEPSRELASAFELSGKLETVNFDEGEVVNAGEVIATLDISLLEAQRDGLIASRSALQAQLTFAEATVERSLDLQDRGFATEERLDQSIANRDELIARIAELNETLRSIEIQIEKSSLVAEFDSRVSERFLDPGATISAGQSVLRIIETEEPLLRVGLPLDLDVQSLDSVEIRINGQSFAAELDSLRADIDPVTRTRTALFKASELDGMSFGRTASLVLEEAIDQAGYWVPLSSLREGRKGEWLMLVLDEEDTVRSASVLIIQTEAERVFVTASFDDGTRFITDGAHRITLGEIVIPVAE